MSRVHGERGSVARFVPSGGRRALHCAKSNPAREEYSATAFGLLRVPYKVPSVS